MNEEVLLFRNTLLTSFMTSYDLIFCRMSSNLSHVRDIHQKTKKNFVDNYI